MKTIVTFGEIMGRINPPGFLRNLQAFPGKAEISFAGSEANVAVSISLFGGRSRFVTALPKHSIAQTCVNTLSGLGVDTGAILRRDIGRLGLYFVEAGANQRPSQVIYDRDGSTVGLTESDQYDWPTIFADAGWFHVSGITPAISSAAARATLDSVKAAKTAGLTVSIDLNFRKKLWRWDSSKKPIDLARETMSQIVHHVDLVVANESDCDDVLDIRAANTDVEQGQLDFSRYPDVARQLVKQYPNVSKVAITLRESVSASHNNWGAMLYDVSTDQAHFAPCDREGEYAPYEIRAIVDRVGAGDSFAAALVFALNCPELSDPSTAVRFATAASCLCHSISGDFNYNTREEVENLISHGGSGRVVR
jgi:2-dehydro-3-deoxygluconokinase